MPTNRDYSYALERARAELGPRAGSDALADTAYTILSWEFPAHTIDLSRLGGTPLGCLVTSPGPNPATNPNRNIRR